MSLDVMLGQAPFRVGDVEGNKQAALALMVEAEARGADVLLLPELALTGYPPEDLLLSSAFVQKQREALSFLVEASKSTTVVCGFVDTVTSAEHDDALPRQLANAVAVFSDGHLRGVVHKRLLPNYGVFDERRYFAPGAGRRQVFDVAGHKVGVLVCEDMWRPEGADELAGLGAEVLLVPNASPFHRGKPATREALVVATSRRTGMSVAYVNTVGGQDEVVFDGGSVCTSATGDVLHRSPLFEDDTPVVTLLGDPVSRSSAALGQFSACEEEEVYKALVRALGDYVNNNSFPGVVLGLSGGIDSALVAAIAVDALGKDRVVGIGMPGPYSSNGSVADAQDLADALGIRLEVLPIKDVYQEYTSTLSTVFKDLPMDVAEENLQARARGTLLMAFSNKFGHMVLSTGNKSETAVGYSTLYGDMCGGYAVLSDVEKTLVYRLSHWRNTRGWRGSEGVVIPISTLTKPPSAELAPDQQDSDSLPPYDVLDKVLERYIEWAQSPSEILAQLGHLEGVTIEMVARVVSLVDRSEYKRRQAPPGVKVTRRAFGRDRRLPITSLWRPAQDLTSTPAPTAPSREAAQDEMSALLDPETLDAWWQRPRSALEGLTPEQAWEGDPERVSALASEATLMLETPRERA